MYRKIEMYEDSVLIGAIYKNINEDDCILGKRLITDCMYYITNENDEVDSYLDDMQNILTEYRGSKNRGDYATFWDTLLESGIFHDAVGKVTYSDLDSFEVMFEY